MIYLDTSALIKLYLLEPGSGAVHQAVVGQDEPLPVWELQEMELANALRLKAFRKEIGVKDVEAQLALFARRKERGFYFFPDLDRGELFGVFMRLSAENTAKLGCRTLDILHVACARLLDPRLFLTADSRQHELAGKAGLPSRLVA
jgi:predicted nucleic acid-binding protein